MGLNLRNNYYGDCSKFWENGFENNGQHCSKIIYDSLKSISHIAFVKLDR